LKPEHAIWNGSINFGTVGVLVKLHPAVREQRIQFNLLHKRDLVKLKRQMVCSLDGAPVPPEDQARGFELEGGKYILVDPAELEATESEAARSIEVHEFVPVADIDPVFLERSYFLEPGEGSGGRGIKGSSEGGGVYWALTAVLEEERLVGICTWTMRKRSYLGALVSAGKLLRLNTLRYPGEVIKAARPATGEAPSERELTVGMELINHMSGRFKPEQFQNRHEQRLQELIDRKARGQKIRLVRPRHKAATDPDRLLAALEASLKKVA
jgi:DNA end-binding protein Ku